jgi:hypothetical protein
MLGDLVARLEDEVAATEVLLWLDDLPLVARVAAASEKAGISPGVYAATAVGHFASEATDEEWLSLIGVMNQDADPGSAFMRRALAKSLRSELGGALAAES